MPHARIGIIGGTGLYQIEGLTSLQEVRIKTPFGDPSDSIITGELSGITMAFLPRHGRGHRIMPTEIPARANIYALKSLGVEWIIAINSCGSFREEYRPGDFLIPDQLIDRTRLRANTFFGSGLAGHIPFAEPFCPVLSDILFSSAREFSSRIHKGGTCVVMEGPAFSTIAESRLYKSWGADIINMTMLPEAKLAREAEICYATVACVTDYDSWRQKGTHEPVKVDIILATLSANIVTAKQIIKHAATLIPPERNCECVDALKTSIVTSPHLMNAATKKNLQLLLRKYI